MIEIFTALIAFVALLLAFVLSQPPRSTLATRSRRALAAIVDTLLPGEALIGKDDVVVVSGGGRGVTASCVIEWAKDTSARFLLLGRSELVDEPACCARVASLACMSARAAKPTCHHGLGHRVFSPAPPQVDMHRVLRPPRPLAVLENGDFPPSRFSAEEAGHPLKNGVPQPLCPFADTPPCPFPQPTLCPGGQGAAAPG